MIIKKIFLGLALAGGGLLVGLAAVPSGMAAEKAKVVVQHVDAAGGEKLLAEKKDVVVLDIRTPKEFASGRIPKAVNVDFYAADFEKKLGQLERGKTYLVHCASGGRSGRSLEVFKKLEFPSVYHLDGGFNAWQRAGKAVER